MITLSPPGDKSVSHRAVLLSALASEPSSLRGLGDGADVATTLRIVGAMGASVRPSGESLVRIDPGAGPREPDGVLDCGNSGTTARLAAGVLSGLGLGAVLDGDASLRARPMRRVVYPLQAMGARIDYLGERDRLPVAVRSRASGSLRTLRHRPRVASAQVKSAILLAGVLGRVAVEVAEPTRSRDHTERMLGALGVPIDIGDSEGGAATVGFDPSGWSGVLAPLDLEIPGDPSSAAFMIGAALLMRRPIRIEGVSDNPTRTGFLAILEQMGASVARDRTDLRCGEPVATWTLTPPERLRGFEVGGAAIPGVIDELPLLAVLATRAVGRSVIRDAAELRVKESDRIERLATNLSRLGVTVLERDDGLEIEGTTARLEGVASPAGDHRIAMGLGVLGATPVTRIEHEDPGCADVSYPGFWGDLERVTGRHE